MKTISRVFLVWGVTFMLALLSLGCGPPLTVGTVVKKEHQPEKKWVQIILIPRSQRIGKVTTTSFMPIPMFHHRPEQWAITIEGEVEGKHKARTVYVSQDTFNQVWMGATYTVSPGDNSNLPIERHRASDQEKATYGVKPAE